MMHIVPYNCFVFTTYVKNNFIIRLIHRKLVSLHFSLEVTIINLKITIKQYIHRG